MEDFLSNLQKNYREIYNTLISEIDLINSSKSLLSESKKKEFIRTFLYFLIHQIQDEMNYLQRFILFIETKSNELKKENNFDGLNLEEIQCKEENFRKINIYSNIHSSVIKDRNRINNNLLFFKSELLKLHK